MNSITIIVGIVLLAIFVVPVIWLKSNLITENSIFHAVLGVSSLGC